MLQIKRPILGIGMKILMRASQGFWGTGAFISGEQRSKNDGNKGNFGEQGNKVIYFRGNKYFHP